MGRRSPLRLTRRPRRPRLQPGSRALRPRGPSRRPLLQDSPLSSAPARLRGRRRDRLRKPERRSNPGARARPFRAPRSGLRRRHRERVYQLGACRKRQPRLPGGRPQRRRPWLHRLDPNWPLQWPTSPPPSRPEPAGRRRLSEHKAARTRVYPGWRRSTQAGRSGRTRPMMGKRPARHQLSQAVLTRRCNRPGRRRLRPNLIAPPSRRDRMRRFSAPSRLAPKSPSRNACCGLLRRLFSAW